MKVVLSMLLGLAMVFALALTASAEEKKAEAKEVTVTGTITCAKCDLKEADKCATVIKGKAKGSDKEEVFYLDDKSAKENHKTICTTPKKGSVTGTVTEKDGKKTIKVDKVKFDDAN